MNTDHTDHTDKKGIINKMKICVYRARHASREPRGESGGSV
jgi:hypothetical protein